MDLKQKESFFALKNILEDKILKLVIPYSNAHLNDLMKSYDQGERIRVKANLEYLSKLSNDICLTHYWHEEHPLWHRRLPSEFFGSLIEESGNHTMSFNDLIESLKEFGMEKILDLWKLVPHNMNFDELEKHNSFFASLFHRSKHENSMHAVIMDVFTLFEAINQNPIVYNQLRFMFKENLGLNPHISNFQNPIEQLDKILPKTMLNKSFTELYEDQPKNEYTKSKNYEKLVTKFMQLDFVGFHSDKLTNKNRYSNLFNDALHCYYAAHCDYYVTNDKKSYRKTKALFEEEKIATKVMKPKEFLEIIKKGT